MGAVLAFPLLVIILAVYNIIAFTDIDSLAQEAFGFAMVSGAVVDLSWGDLVVLAGLALLAIEVLKSAQSGHVTILDHVLSIAVLVAALAELVMIEQAATATFLILVVICLIDVIASFGLSTRAARRRLPPGRREGW